MQNIRYNRIKIVLVEKQKTSKMLAEHLGVRPVTVSRWCTNDSQPNIPTLFKIVLFLDVEIEELLTDPKLVALNNL